MLIAQSQLITSNSLTLLERGIRIFPKNEFLDGYRRYGTIIGSLFIDANLMLDRIIELRIIQLVENQRVIDGNLAFDGHFAKKIHRLHTTNNKCR